MIEKSAKAISATTKLTPMYRIRLKLGKNLSESSKIFSRYVGVSFVAA